MQIKAAATLIVSILLLTAAACSGQETPLPTLAPTPTPLPTATLPSAIEPTATLAPTPSPTPTPEEIVAASVRGVEFTMGDLVQRIRAFQAINDFRGRQTDLNTVPFEYLQEWIFAEILRQQAPELGIQPSEGAITRELLSQFRPASSSGQEPNTESLDRESGNNYKSFLTTTGLSDSDYRAIVEEQLILADLNALLAENIQSTQEQVEVQWIHFSDIDADIDEIIGRINIRGFDAVAQELATADGYADSSGYVGWVPRRAFPDLDPFLYGDDDRNLPPLAPGKTSQPLYTNDGIYIVNMLSGLSSRELSDKMRVKLTAELAQAWHEEQLRSGMEDGSIRINFNSRLYDWVVAQVGAAR